MTNEDYVSLEVAKMLEEKGFNAPCDSRHIEYEDGTYKFERYKTFDIQKDIGIVKIKDGCFYDSYLAPTLYEAQKWLRKIHDIHIVISPHYSRKYEIIEYEYRVATYFDFLEKPFKWRKSKEYYEEYEQCLNNAIFEALELI